MFDGSTALQDGVFELPQETCFAVIESFVELCRDLSQATGLIFRPRFVLSGGDPLLHPQFWSILERISEIDSRSMILGNADLLDAKVADRLRQMGAISYQLSLDGIEPTHDRIRSRGNFQKTIEAVKILKKAGIAPHLMATVFRDNVSEIPELAQMASEVGVHSFSFARATSVGNARDLDLAIRPGEYRSFLLAMHEVQERLKNEGSATKFPRKDHLWTLLLYELGELKLYKHVNPGKIVDGCHMGQTFLVLLADGTAMSCRRFPSVVGRFPDRSLSELFMNSPEMISYRKVHDLESCRDCELLYHCRGCRAVAYGMGGKWRSPDPQCWKKGDIL